MSVVAAVIVSQPSVAVQPQPQVFRSVSSVLGQVNTGAIAQSMPSSQLGYLTPVNTGPISQPMPSTSPLYRLDQQGGQGHLVDELRQAMDSQRLDAEELRRQQTELLFTNQEQAHFSLRQNLHPSVHDRQVPKRILDIRLRHFTRGWLVNDISTIIWFWGLSISQWG